MDLRSGLRLLREQWEVILAATIAAAAISGVLTWRETPQYASQVTLFVSAWGSAEDTASAYQGSLLSQQKVKSYTELLRGQHVMAEAVERLDLEITPRQLSGKVTTAAIPDTSLLTATVQDSSPEQAQRIAEVIGEEFVQLVPTLESVDDGERSPVKVTVVSPAEAPTGPVSPRPVRNHTVAVVLGLLAGFGLALVRRSLDTSVKTVPQAEEISEVPSLGTVAFDPSAAKHPLIVAGQTGPRAEAFRRIRTNLQFADVDRAHQAILVTSAVPNEGKSVTACDLAVVLAESDKRVILVDGDLRRHSTAEYLGLPNGVGLTSVLLGQVRLADAVQTWGHPAVSVLCSGPVPPNPTTLLASQRLRTLLDELRHSYDVIVIDSPPVLPIADAAVLAATCDGAVVVIRHGRTSQEQLRCTVQALRTSGVPILGTVLNSTPPGRDSYYTYGYVQSFAAQPGGAPADPAASAGAPAQPAGADPVGLR